MLEKLEKFNRMVGGWAEWVGFGALFLMVVLTCVDVLGAKLFRLRVFGALDVMMLAQLIAISFAAAMALIQDRHIRVEFFMLLFPKRIQALVDCLIQLFCLGLFVLIVWRLFVHGYHLQTGGEETATARIPLSPFSYASALAIISVCLVLLQKFLSSILRVIKNES
ncbi:MAG: TRAP transporter small permease [Deltaproteobacteria bacterium]|nr:TRAP transporter small permease [Deltaproteobacteria bacterium]